MHSSVRHIYEKEPHISPRTVPDVGGWYDEVRYPALASHIEVCLVEPESGTMLQETDD